MTTSDVLQRSQVRSAVPGRRATNRRLPLGLTALAVLVVAAAMLPLVYLVIRAAGAAPRAWEQLLQPRTLAIFANSALLVVTVTGAALLLAVPLAWLTSMTDLPGRRFWTIATTLPLVIPSYVGAYAILTMFGPRGILQGWLAPLGVERLPEIYGFPGAWLALTLFTYPYVLMTVRAAWRRLDASLEEAARSLGHGPWSAFRRATLPHLRPGMAAGGLLVALYTLSDFGAVSLLRFNVFTQAIFVQYRSSFDRSLAALLSLLLVATTLAILWAEQRAQGRSSRLYRSHGSSARPPKLVRLGKWTWPALFFCGFVVVLALGLPLGVTIYWLAPGLLGQASIDWPDVGRAALNSLYAAGLAALVTSLAALPVALVSARYCHRLTHLLERASHVGYGLPGLVIALSLVFFGANYAPFLYQTLALLIFAYAVRFLPQAVGSTRTSLLQVNPRLEEAGRNLGLSSWQVWLKVTLPLVRPGILAGTALVFLTTIKELPATLLLGPTGFDTLASEIWSATAEAFFAKAAAPALILVAVSSLSIAVILSQDRDHARATQS